MLIRCYLQPSLAEALCLCNFVSISTDRTVCDVRVWERSCLSPHGALRAYTVFLTAEPRRGSSRVLSSSVTVSDAHRWCNFFSIRDRPHLPEVRIRGVLSCHRMSHYVLIRCFLQPSLAEALCWRDIFSISTDRTSPRCESTICTISGWRTACLP